MAMTPNSLQPYFTVTCLLTVNCEEPLTGTAMVFMVQKFPNMFEFRFENEAKIFHLLLWNKVINLPVIDQFKILEVA